MTITKSTNRELLPLVFVFLLEKCFEQGYYTINITCQPVDFRPVAPVAPVALVARESRSL